MLTCKNPRSEGQQCESTVSCSKDFECSASRSAPPFFAVCVNASQHSISLGKRCVPGGLKKCSARFYDQGRLSRLVDLGLECAKDKLGYKCQKVARFYEQCDVEKDTSCIKGSKCSDYGVCIPQ